MIYHFDHRVSKLNSRIAQLVERMTVNHDVGGSSPSLGAKQGRNMDIEKLKQTIKSNLVSSGLLPEQIESITEQLLADILDLMRLS